LGALAGFSKTSWIQHWKGSFLVFSWSKTVAIKEMKQGYYRSWCLVAGGNLLEAGRQVNSFTTMVAYLRPLFFYLRKIEVSSPILAASASQR
jgi:hypothetical protein